MEFLDDDYLKNLFIDEPQRQLGIKYISNIIKCKILIKKKMLENKDYSYLDDKLEEHVENLENLIYSPNEKFFFDTPQKVYKFRIDILNIIDNVIDEFM